MSGMEDFYTRDKANEGIKVPLYLPDGKESEHSIKIRGVDSDIFRAADTEARRAALQIARSGLSDEEKNLAYKKVENKLIASLVISWTFDKECTLDNVVEFLENAPQIKDGIDLKAGNRKAFLEAWSSDSLSTQEGSSSSTKE